MTTAPVLNVPIESTMLASVGYDASQSILDLEFCGGDIYRYSAVPASIFNQLLVADSKGSFFNRHIRNRFRYTRIKTPR
jgi:KTSC domain